MAGAEQSTSSKIGYTLLRGRPWDVVIAKSRPKVVAQCICGLLDGGPEDANPSIGQSGSLLFA
jgi:hypothetical protein